MINGFIEIFRINRNTLCIILGITLLQFPIFVMANDLGITVNKTEIVFDVDKNSIKEFVVSVKNNSEDRREVSIGKVDYKIEDNNEVVLSRGAEDSGIKNWITVVEKKILLEPGGEREVNFKVKIPENVIVGSHKGLVTFSVVTNSEENINITGQIGVHVLINIRGKSNKLGRLNYLNVPLLSNGDVEYIAEFENSGSAHYTPVGKIFVRNVVTNFEEVYDYDKHFVFPGRKFLFYHKERIPSLVGIYFVKVLFVDGDGNECTKERFVMGSFLPFFIFILVISWYAIQQRVHKYKNSISVDKIK